MYYNQINQVQNHQTQK